MKKLPRWLRNTIYAVGGLAVVSAIVIAVLGRTVWAVNARARNAAGEAFDALYACEYDRFVKATIYNETCQNRMKLDMTGFLQNNVKPMFDEMKQLMEQENTKYRRKATDAREYKPGEEGFSEGIRLLAAEYADTDTEAVERVARVEIEFEWQTEVSEGQKESGRDTETYWCFRVDGKWYACPILQGE